MTENTKTNLIDKKDLKRVSLRWLFASQITWNYEKMMAPGYLYTILPILQKLYPDKDKLREMMKMHIQFFNTAPHMGGLILGIDTATEEHEGINSKEAVAGMKTGLMGPFAGIGDTIFGVLIPTIFGSIASYLALEGNYVGVLIWIAVGIAINILRYFSVFWGYNQGVKLITTMSGRLSALTKAATLMGITVIGALIPSVVRANVSATFVSGEVNISIQEILDQIMPSLVPVVVVLLVYMLLGYKKMTSTKAILLVMVLSILLYSFKILG